MIVSMTGYGCGTAQGDGVTISVEGRSLNHRFCDVSIKLPASLSSLEKKIRDMVMSFFQRGKIDLYISLNKQSDTAQLQINFENASKYYQALLGLCNHLEIKEEVSLSSMTPFIRDIIEVQESSLNGNGDMHWPLIEQAVQQVLVSIQSMRASEGKSLCADIQHRVEYIETIISSIQEKTSMLVREYRDQLSARIAEHFPELSVEPGRLEQEIVMVAEKLDVTEELTRIKSHFSQMKEFLASDGPMGRKLDFLLQEIHREVNTLSYKSNSADISQKVVEIKGELEKIREQIQNIE
ncbi:MAG: YicC/YloC family endoribonuclease [bacterium]